MVYKTFWKVILAGFLYAIVAQIVHSIGAVLSMSYYMIPEFFPVWSRLMMPSIGPPPPSFMAFSIFFGFLTGILFAYVYNRIKPVIKTKNIGYKGVDYGLILFMLAGIPASLMVILLINLPLMLVIYWTIESLVAYVLGGMVIAKVMR